MPPSMLPSRQPQPVRIFLTTLIHVNGYKRVTYNLFCAQSNSHGVFMRAKVAVATVSGKAYFFLVNELREKNIDFVSIVPSEPVPAEAKVVVTTEKEKYLINHERVLVFDPETEPSTVINEAARILQGKETYEKIVVGVDPGEVFGLAVIADG